MLNKLKKNVYCEKLHHIGFIFFIMMWTGCYDYEKQTIHSYETNPKDSTFQGGWISYREEIDSMYFNTDTGENIYHHLFKKTWNVSYWYTKNGILYEIIKDMDAVLSINRYYHFVGDSVLKLSHLDIRDCKLDKPCFKWDSLKRVTDKDLLNHLKKYN